MYILYLFYFVLTYVLYICMFPACCFPQRTYVTQGLVNGVLIETWTHSCFQFRWPSVGQAALYRGHSLSFLECVYFGLLYPSLIFDMFTTPMPIHTHTQLLTYQILKMGKADQSKHTPGKRENNPYINPPDQPRVIYTGNKREFKSNWVRHKKGLVPHMFSDESNKLETYIYIACM